MKTRVSKKSCVGSHDTKKPCEKSHEPVEESMIDDKEESVLSPNSEKRKRSESSSRSSQRSSEDLDLSQVMFFLKTFIDFKPPCKKTSIQK